MMCRKKKYIAVTLILFLYFTYVLIIKLGEIYDRSFARFPFFWGFPCCK